MQAKSKPQINPSDIIKFMKDTLDDMQKVASDLQKTGKIRPKEWSKLKRVNMKDLRKDLKDARLAGYQVESEKDKAHRKVIDNSLVKRLARLQKAMTERPAISRKQRDSFVVSGRVVDKKSGVGLPDVIVKAFDMDRKYDDLLGSTVTNKDGYYQVEYTTKDFKDLFDKKPETYIEVLDQEGHTLYTFSKSFVLKSGKQEIVDAEVDGKKLAASLDRGKAIQAARKIDLGAIAGRSVALKGRLAIPRRALGKLRRGKTVEKDKLRQNVAPRTEVKTNVKPKTAAVSEVQPAKKTRETTPKKTAAKTKSSSATRSTPAGQKAKSKKKATIRAKSKSATKATAAKKKAKRKSTTRKER